MTPNVTHLDVMVARWADKAREATVRRDNLIRDMRSEGCSLRQIAAAASLSHTAVANILAKPAAGWHPESPPVTARRT
jgi:DNA invertase Pin-like site-specific DNA recombinase